MNLAMNPMQPNPRNNLTEMYPGIYQPGLGVDHHDGPNLPTAPLNTLLGFELETYQVPLDQLLPSKKVPDGVMSTRKYKQIVSSINEVGLIEPLSILHPDTKKSEYLLLDGHLRVLALKELGLHEAPCLFAKDDETYTYNHRVNRLSTIQEHYMIRRAIDRGVSKERLARAFNVNLSSINRRINLLEGICPEAITLLQDKQFTPDVTRILRNMKAARQVEAVELMIPYMIRTLLSGERPKLTKAEQVWDYIHVDDVADAIVAALQTGARGIFNLGSGQARPLREIIERLDAIEEPDLGKLIAKCLGQNTSAHSISSRSNA